MNKGLLKRAISVILILLILQGMFGTPLSIAVEEISNSVNSTANEAVEIKKEQKQEENAVAKINQQVFKYIPYVIENEQRALLETNIEIALEHNIRPVSEEKIVVEVPKINNNLPQKVNVSALDESIELDDSNCYFDSEKGLISISIKKEVKNDESIDNESKEEVLEKVLSSSELEIKEIEEKNDNSNSLNEKFKITYIYQMDSQETKEYTINLNSAIIYKLDSVEKEIIGKESKTETIMDSHGSFVNVDIEINNTINKGYLYTRLENTYYQKNISINVSDNSLIDELRIIENKDMFVVDNNNQVEVQAASRKIQVDTSSARDVLGEDGKITITGENEESIVIDLLSQEEKTEISLEGIEGNLTISTTKPAKEGIINIKLLKEISKDNGYTYDQIKRFKQIATKTEAKIIYKENDLPVEINNIVSNLEEPTTKVKASMNKQGLTTVEKNENVEIRIVLETNSVDDMLLKNPQIAILLPKEVKEVNLTNYNVLFSDEIKISKIEPVESENGKTIVIGLEGTQTKYSSNIEEGINVVLNMDITLDRLAASRETEILISYLNENEDGVKRMSAPIKIVAPMGVILVSEIEGASKEQNKVTIVDEKSKDILFKTYGEARNVRVSGQIINNNNNSISNLKIIGRISNGKEGEKIEAKLNSLIATSHVNAKVYYSPKEDASSSLEDEQNMWGDGATNIEDAKSYLIVLDGELERGNSIKFGYDMSIPENLSYNLTSKAAYMVSYTNNTDIKKAEVKNSATTVFTTGKGPKIELNLETSEKVQSIAQGQYVSFVATVKNTGTEDATNVVLSIDESLGKVKKYSEGLDFVDAESIKEIGTIKAGEVKQIEYIQEIKDDIQAEENQSFKIKVQADKIDKVIEMNKTINVKKGVLQIKNLLMASSKDSDVAELVKGESNACGIFIKNISGEKLSNIKIIYNVDGKIDIQEAGRVYVLYSPLENTENGIISNNKHTLTYNIDSLENEESTIVKLNFNPNKEGNNVKFTAEVDVSLNGLEYQIEANTQVATIKEPKIEITAGNIDSKNSEVKNGSEVTYVFKLKNTGELTVGLGNLFSKIPSELDFKKAVISSKIGDADVYSETVEVIENNEFKYEKTFLEVNEEITIEIVATVNAFDEQEINNGKWEKRIAMNMEYTAMGIDVKSEEEAYYAVYEKPEEQAKYKITGKVWNDKNKNAIREKDEPGIEGIKIMLIDANTMQAIKNSEGKNIVIASNQNGDYQFENLNPGKYVVAFLSDMDVYGASQYQKEGVLNTVNSDALEKTATYKNQKIKMALTDILEISTESARDVDVGLYEKDRFDLNVSKSVDKITVYEDGNVEEYKFANNNNATTLELKNNDKEKQIIVEYKVKVSNLGNVEGYANKIANYIPEDMSFNSSLNPDWYIGYDGICYSTAMSDYKLKPGETKEISLILSKTVTTEEEIIDNSEIVEEYNEKGVESYAVLTGNSRISSTSIEVVNKKPSYMIITILAVVLAIALSSSSIIYMERENLLKNKYIRSAKNRIIKVLKDLKNI